MIIKLKLYRLSYRKLLKEFGYRKFILMYIFNKHNIRSLHKGHGYLSNGRVTIQGTPVALKFCVEVKDA